MSARLEALQAMLERGQDSALLRFSLGSEYLAADRAAEAVPQLEEAIRQDPGYSAAYKLLGKALAACGETGRAMQAYRDGIAVAEERGDRQAVREMGVFLKRLAKDAGKA